MVGFLGDLMKPKFHSEINWPLLILFCLIRYLTIPNMAISESIWLHCKRRAQKLSRLQFMRRYTRAISSFKKSLTAITFDGSLVAFILALYSIFLGLLIKTFELQSSKCNPWSRKLVTSSMLKLLVVIWRKKLQMIFQKVYIRWIIGGHYCGLVQDLFWWDFKN